MTENQEEALYSFLENIVSPFSLEDAAAHIRKHGSSRGGRHLIAELTSLMEIRNIAFPVGPQKWMSRRGCFEKACFAISPTREELLNGVLIPGHRCAPFANPILMPQEYEFFWNSQRIPSTTSEGDPENFYPYYSIFGEEYAPQYVARDNPRNEAAFNEDPYEDPVEVSIHVLDMRNIYLSSTFVPGDRFEARILDWKKGKFALERVAKDQWSEEDLHSWLVAAEQGFMESFATLGPGLSTEEQIAFAYWYGGERMRSVPAYALEEFLYEKTERIETVGYGIETRFWYAGREIPDSRELEKSQMLPDRTLLEDMLFQKRIPISEYVVMSYVRDALFRGDTDVGRVIERILPQAAGTLNGRERTFLTDYIVEVFNEFRDTYNRFADKNIGPIRQRVGELHTAVIDLAARLRKGDIAETSLPKHTFIILSQIQEHAAAVLEDLNTDKEPPESDFEAIDNSIDSMIDTYEDIRGLINESMDDFRQRNFSVVRNIDSNSGEGRIVQISITGTDVWRRLDMSSSYSLLDTHRMIQFLFNWKGAYGFRFLSGNKTLDSKQCLHELNGTIEVSYEYGPKWIVKLMFLSASELDKGVRCIAGAGSAPPETLDGPIRFRRYLDILENGSPSEKRKIQQELGEGFDPTAFNTETCNTMLKEFEKWKII
ncbi:MAG: plasmid pRiA4b ORF-3 family protein [Treponema sp.]|jgi:hypothetical protein|nr:plasmid pRiA4b ORF-3 family protein [Treponema sp.]